MKKRNETEPGADGEALFFWNPQPVQRRRRRFLARDPIPSGAPRHLKVLAAARELLDQELRARGLNPDEKRDEPGQHGYEPPEDGVRESLLEAVAEPVKLWPGPSNSRMH